MSAIHPQAAQLQAMLQQAIQLHQGGRLREAEELYRRILQVVPHHPDTNNNLSIALVNQGRLEEAAAVLQRLVVVAPNNVAAHSNLGNILFELGKPEEAEASYRRALDLKPDMLDALKNLGTAICKNGRFPESFQLFRRHAELAYGQPSNGPLVRREPVPLHKTKHDQEQRDYIGTATGQRTGAFHLDEGKRIAGRAINPDRSGGNIATRWQSSDAQIAVIDNFLTDEALDALRRFCWRSTMWHKIYDDGYLGAMPEHGFICPLLVQIDEELRSTYPAIMGEYPLLHWWAFKYDSKLSGTAIHADFAAVNVNFWITPDDANLNPESGGLVIWDKPAPMNWTFDHYNGDQAAIRNFLSQADSRSITVPYRSNRAVIFDSDLFHETDRIAFKEGYLNRRINITMLYGRREAAKKPS
jgi:Tfp pilus assembly protein PilF